MADPKSYPQQTSGTHVKPGNQNLYGGKGPVKQAANPKTYPQQSTNNPVKPGNQHLFGRGKGKGR